MYYDILINNKRNKYVQLITKKLLHLRSYIIRKCDDPTYYKYANYGGRGVTYDQTWKDKDKFLQDICSVEGFNFMSYIKGELSLDKDLKDYKAKIYSKETCTWVTNAENEVLKPSRMKTYYGFNLAKGITYIFNQKADFAKRMNISEKVVIIQTRRRNSLNSNISHIGWFFWSEDDDNLPNVNLYWYSNAKGNISISSTLQLQVEQYAHLSGSTFYKLVRSNKRSKIIKDQTQILLVDGKKYTFPTIGNIAKFFGISRSNLANKINKSTDFKISGRSFHIIKTTEVVGKIGYHPIDLFANVIDLRK